MTIAAAGIDVSKKTLNIHQGHPTLISAGFP